MVWNDGMLWLAFNSYKGHTCCLQANDISPTPRNQKHTEIAYLPSEATPHRGPESDKHQSQVYPVQSSKRTSHLHIVYASSTPAPAAAFHIYPTPVPQFPKMSGLKNTRVAVIGGGMAGLAASRSLLAEGFNVTIFESRSQLGGVWTGEGLTGGGDGLMYDGLETNVARSMMTFSDQPWRVTTPLFPPDSCVKEYLQDYANTLRASPDGRESLSCRVGTQVIDIRFVPGSETWEVISQTVHSLNGQEKQTFHRVVVAMGTFNTPSMPETDLGRSEWELRHPGTLFHSSKYQSAEPFTGKTVLIVGNGPSAAGIGRQICEVADRVVFSLRTDRPIIRGAYKAGPIERLIPSRKTVHFHGTPAERFDYIIYCTGFLYDFPFPSWRNDPLFNSGINIPNLYQHIFYQPIPTLAFVGLPRITATFMIAEAQAAVVARVFSRRLPQPTDREMNRWERNVRSTDPNMMMAVARGLSTPDEYINLLHNWSWQARNFSRGPDVDEKLPPFYCRCMVEAQKVSDRVRRLYMARGARRFDFTTYGSLNIRLNIPCPSARRSMPLGCSCAMVDRQASWDI
ncbi:unnamed protein product [Zymoseptoria tritici ST99CH_3D1]|nr:unnamed protein product [Zymoseptoria tritici ST99CH_3D1]